MVIIRFPDPVSERKALGSLAGRFSFKTSATGETFVPEGALPFLAREGIKFSVEGPAAPALPLEPRDDWERKLFGAAIDCGVSVPDSALSSDGLYE